MFDQSFITKAISRSAENGLDRRRFFRTAGLTGLGVGGAAMLATAAPAHAAPMDTGGPSDSAILNFALNLEYLEAEFYLRAIDGQGLPSNLVGGTGTPGGVTGGHAVPFKTKAIELYAREIAADEKAHVAFLRTALGNAAVSRPSIDIGASFTAAAVAAGLIKEGEPFDVYESEENFLLGAFIFEDVGVTAYKGAAPLIDNKTFLDAAAGLLAVEAYHAGIIRTNLFAKGLQVPAMAISDARDSLDGPDDLDQGIGTTDEANLVPTDANALTFSRTPGQVLNIVYLNPEPVRSGGFFPNGVNGELNGSGTLAAQPSGAMPGGAPGTGVEGSGASGPDMGLIGAGGGIAAAAAAALAIQHKKGAKSAASNTAAQSE
ncbi:ferritin-like domain-containing protein [Arthrobacter sp. H14]|uniref:ferritin-like domain-containing protein n=1 Tax=Arthrobacter sp. H14 TaxID=1312959 RepID=UPI0004B546B1|nr:ferritin-like domain-containing protein [Arthrobacter sp. H14]